MQSFLARLLEVWPEHSEFLTTRFPLIDGADLVLDNMLADKALQIAGGDISRYCEDYRWMCNKLVLENVYFLRHGHYRLQTVSDACREVYDDVTFMTRYMNGLLLSQVLWSNHAGAFGCYLHRFLPSHRPNYKHLEIGPGHGLMLSLAASDPRCGSATGWDISASSVAATKQVLQRLGAGVKVELQIHDILRDAQSTEKFDSIVVSEVLEHLESPAAALECAKAALAPGGRMFINVPVNSPAPDHIFLFRTPEEVRALIQGAGFAVEGFYMFPATGFAEDEARRRKLTISCVAIATAVQQPY